jgi:hypothetical protein
MTSNEQRAEVLQRAIRASRTGDSTVIAELFTSDVDGCSPAMSISSAAELAVEFEDRDEAFSEVEIDTRPLDVCGEQACVEWIVTMTHSGPLQIDDEYIAPSGRRLTMQGATIAEFTDLKIRCFREYWDEVSLLEQLDLLRHD